MDQHATWGNATPAKKKQKMPFRGFQKITDTMDDAQRRGAEIWNEMVKKLIELNEMERK